MKYTDKHIVTATTLIVNFNGAMPLSNFLKQYFSANKKYGSRDRKQISHFCFLYYRFANAVQDASIDEIITIALFICEDSLEPYINLFKQAWQTNWHETKACRLNFIQSVYPNFNIPAIFPFVNELSEGMDHAAFSVSHLTQPNLFLRIRPNFNNKVLKKLASAHIAFEQVTDTCLALPNNSKINTILDVDREVVVQDYSSQRIVEFLSFLPSTINYQPSSFSVWDCCAASGGKSILAYDILGNIKITVSDIRGSIIQNLKARFVRAGIVGYQAFVADVSNSNYQLPTTNYQLILCDAPCSGSGTWGRTPEYLCFFKQTDIEKYTKLQQQIIANTLPHLAANGYFLYITCSVFKQENEAMVSFIQQQNHSLTLLKKELLIGYNNKADSMFVALFKA